MTAPLLTDGPPPEPERQPRWFLLLYALASAGGAVAFVPLLTVLLPQRIAELQGGEDVAVLAQVTFFGAVVASVANIAVGTLSDRSRVRRPWILAGLVLSSGLLIAVGAARSASELVLLVMAWQVGLNLMLSPLMAWAGDCFPDRQKGVLGGALALSPALGALAGSLVTWGALVPPGAPGLMMRMGRCGQAADALAALLGCCALLAIAARAPQVASKRVSEARRFMEWLLG